MAASLNGFLPQLSHWADVGSLDGTDDARLLARFRETRCPVAFEALVRRYGPLVYGICRRVLSDPNSIDDAVQATFLVFVRRADALRCNRSLSNWFYTVARHCAFRLRRRREPRPLNAEPIDSGRNPLDALTGRELCAALEEELDRLPERYRLPGVLCCPDGL